MKYLSISILLFVFCHVANGQNEYDFPPKDLAKEKVLIFFEKKSTLRGYSQQELDEINQALRDALTKYEYAYLLMKRGDYAENKDQINDDCKYVLDKVQYDIIRSVSNGEEMVIYKYKIYLRDLETQDTYLIGKTDHVKMSKPKKIVKMLVKAAKA